VIVDEQVQTAGAEDEIGTDQLAGRLAGVDETRVVVLRPSETEPFAAVISGSDGRCTGRRGRSIPCRILRRTSRTASHAVTADTAAVIDTGNDVTVTQTARRRNGRTNRKNTSHASITAVGVGFKNL